MARQALADADVTNSRKISVQLSLAGCSCTGMFTSKKHCPAAPWQALTYAYCIVQSKSWIYGLNTSVREAYQHHHTSYTSLDIMSAPGNRAHSSQPERHQQQQQQGHPTVMSLQREISTALDAAASPVSVYFAVRGQAACPNARIASCISPLAPKK